MSIKWIGIVDDKETKLKLDALVENAGGDILWYEKADSMKKKLNDDENTVLFIKESPNFDIYELCQDLFYFSPFVSIVLIMDEKNVDLKKAMKSGAADIVPLPLNDSDFNKVIEEIKSNFSRKRELNIPSIKKVNKCTVISVCSTKGGVGKTTITVNLAASYSQKGNKVVVVDCNLQFGDVALTFDVKPKRTIYEWAVEEYGRFNSEINRYLLKHERSGVDILAAPLRPEFADVFTEDHIKETIEQLRKMYDIVLIDIPSYLTGTSLVSLENSDEILLVTSMDLPTLKNTKLYLETLESLKLKEKVKVILNNFAKVNGINSEIISNILGVSLFGTIIKKDKIALASLNEGVPFVLSKKNSKISKDINVIAEKLLSIDQPKKKKKSFIKVIMSGVKASCLF